MAKQTFAGSGLETYVEQADQTIMKGEERLGRLAILGEVMATGGYETAGITKLIDKHTKLLHVWKTRRSDMVNRLSRHQTRLTP